MIDSIWIEAGLVLIAFVVGMRVSWAILVESGGRKRAEERIRQIERSDDLQQEQINQVLKQVNNLLHGGKVKRITIKRKTK